MNRDTTRKSLEAFEYYRKYSESKCADKTVDLRGPGFDKLHRDLFGYTPSAKLKEFTLSYPVSNVTFRLIV
jgi:hypothetical protein